MPPWVIAAVLAVAALLVLRTLLKTRPGMGPLATGAVRSTEGAATVTAKARGNVDQMTVMAVYRLKVGKVTFPLSATQLAGFDDGVAYRCFYVKGTLPVLTSAEEI